MWSTRSPPPTRTTSEMPAATSITAWRNATWLRGQAVLEGGVGGFVGPRRLAAGDIAVVEGVDCGGGVLRVGDGVAGRLREQLRAAAVMLAELGQPHPD